MQIAVQSVKVLKTGTNDHGDWTFVKVVTNEDIEYTTFAKDAEYLESGTTINVLNLDQDAKGQWTFKKYEVVNRGETPQSTPISATGKPITVARPDNVNGAARGMAVKEIGDMIRAKLLGNIFGDTLAPMLQAWYAKELAEITGVPDSSPNEQPEVQPSKRKPSEVAEKMLVGPSGRDLAELKTQTDVIKAIHADLGVQPKEQLEILGIKKWAETDLEPADLYLKIYNDYEGEVNGDESPF